MPSNFTKHYSLSQWERSDKVLMDDFNADNAKIDAALRDTRPYLIRSWVTEEEAAKVDFDISGIDWKPYTWVFIDVILRSGISIYLAVDNERIAESLPATTTCFLICPVFHRDDICLRNAAISKAGSFGCSARPWRQLETLTLALYGDDGHTRYIGPGAEVKIWGMK